MIPTMVHEHTSHEAIHGPTSMQEVGAWYGLCLDGFIRAGDYERYLHVAVVPYVFNMSLGTYWRRIK